MSEGIMQADKPQVLEPETGDLFSKFDPIIQMREGLLASGQEDPFSLVMEKVPARPALSAMVAIRSCSAPITTWA
jgi:hypothetical protein